MRRLILYTLILFIISEVSFSQELQLIKSFAIPFLNKVSIDVNNSIYVTDEKNNIIKYDSTGTRQNFFSPSRPSNITLIEAWKTMSIFVFYRDLQQYFFLNRFLTPSQPASINNENIGFAYMAAPSQDNNLWIFDNSDFSLKKFDLTINKNSIETPLDLILDPNNYDINLIKEYQNKVYLNNIGKQILVFDNLGNYQETFPIKTNYFNFYGEEIYYIEGEAIVFYNIYKGNQRSISLKDTTAQAKYVLYTGKNIILIKEIEALIYKLN